jgi:hypothetical protein
VFDGQIHRRRSALGLVSHRRRHSTVAVEYGSPPEIAGTPAPGSAFMILARPLAVH